MMRRHWGHQWIPQRNTSATHSGNLSIWYLCLTTYISGMPGTLRIRLLRSRSHCESLSSLRGGQCLIADAPWPLYNTDAERLAEPNNRPHKFHYLFPFISWPSAGRSDRAHDHNAVSQTVDLLLSVMLADTLVPVSPAPPTRSP